MQNREKIPFNPADKPEAQQERTRIYQEVVSTAHSLRLCGKILFPEFSQKEHPGSPFEEPSGYDLEKLKELLKNKVIIDVCSGHCSKFAFDCWQAGIKNVISIDIRFADFWSGRPYPRREEDEERFQIFANLDHPHYREYIKKFSKNITAFGQILPIKSEVADYVLSNAGLPRHGDRITFLQFLDEAYRVLKRDGELRAGPYVCENSRCQELMKNYFLDPTRYPLVWEAIEQRFKVISRWQTLILKKTSEFSEEDLKQGKIKPLVEVFNQHVDKGTNSC